jgi:hypothetical protein
MSPRRVRMPTGALCRAELRDSRQSTIEKEQAASHEQSGFDGGRTRSMELRARGSVRLRRRPNDPDGPVTGVGASREARRPREYPYRVRKGSWSMGEGGARWASADAKSHMGQRVCQPAEMYEHAEERGTYCPWLYPSQGIPAPCRGVVVGGGHKQVSTCGKMCEVRAWGGNHHWLTESSRRAGKRRHVTVAAHAHRPISAGATVMTVLL